MATSTVSAKPSMRMAFLSLRGVASLPNWPTKAGATQAIISSPLFMAWMSWKIWLLSAMAAVHEAHAAGDALVVVNLGAALFVGADGVHAAGLGAGALYAADGVVRALREAAAALDAFALVY